MFQIVVGDILDSKEDYICHQVNCKNVMGSGVARAIYTKYPEVKCEYHKFCNLINNPNDLIGKVQYVRLMNEDKYVINIFGQIDYGRDKRILYTSYEALLVAFVKINNNCKGKSLAFPYGFGCGLANGDWKKVESMMIKYLCDCDVKVYMKY